MRALTALCLLVLLASLALLGAPAHARQAARGDASARVAASASVRLAGAIYRQLRRSRGNLLVSPALLASTLALTHSGARGATARELRRALGLQQDRDVMDRAFGALLEQLLPARPATAAARRRALTLESALFLQRDAPLLAPFAEAARRHYRAAPQQVDFTGPAARTRINRWAAAHTAGHIGELLKADQLQPDTRLVLVNAMALDAPWKLRFPLKATRPAPFHRGHGRPLQVPMMALTGSFRYLQRGALQALELPYAQGELALLLLLPRRPGQLSPAERVLTRSGLRRLLRRMPRRKVRVQLPRFRLAHRLDLPPLLRRLGIRTLCSSRADLSGIDGKGELQLGAAVQHNRLAVDEAGTKAASATGAVVLALEGEHEPSPPLFRADRPFLFVVRHRPSGLLLFVGRLMDPGAG